MQLRFRETSVCHGRNCQRLTFEGDRLGLQQRRDLCPKFLDLDGRTGEPDRVEEMVLLPTQFDDPPPRFGLQQEPFLAAIDAMPAPDEAPSL